VNASHVAIVTRASIQENEEVTWDYESVHGSPLVLLTQYGFLPPTDAPGARHVVPLVASGAVADLLEDAGRGCAIDDAPLGPILRRRAAALAFCVGLEATPIQRRFRERASKTVFWVDADDYASAPLLLALRVALATDGEVGDRDRTVRDWLEPLGGDREERATRALRDASEAVFNDLWSSDACPKGEPLARAVVDYQIATLSRLLAALKPAEGESDGKENDDDAATVAPPPDAPPRDPSWTPDQE